MSFIWLLIKDAFFLLSFLKSDFFKDWAEISYWKIRCKDLLAKLHYINVYYSNQSSNSDPLVSTSDHSLLASTRCKVRRSCLHEVPSVAALCLCFRVPLGMSPLRKRCLAQGRSSQKSRSLWRRCSLVPLSAKKFWEHLGTMFLNLIMLKCLLLTHFTRWG